MRLAVPSDAEAVARVQRETWRAAYAALLPPEALAVEVDALAAAWSQSLSAPPSPRHRLLVALEAGEVVGLAASEPADDSAELTALLVEPRWGRRGHGSRLLAATVDHWREDRVPLGTTWVFDSDEVVSDFLRSAGWAPETLARTLEAGMTTVRQRRWHTSLV